MKCLIIVKYVRRVVSTDHNKSLLQFCCLPRSETTRKAAALLGGGREAARRQRGSFPALRAHRRLLPLTPRAHWPNRAIFIDRLRKVYSADRFGL